MFVHVSFPPFGLDLQSIQLPLFKKANPKKRHMLIFRRARERKFVGKILKMKFALCCIARVRIFRLLLVHVRLARLCLRLPNSAWTVL